ncbi:hypothetical protein ACWD6R_29620 [Streptomyces sp. NPDC005151]
MNPDRAAQGWTNAVVRRWADLLLALPALLVTIVVAGTGGGGYALAVGVLVVLTSPGDSWSTCW